MPKLKIASDGDLVNKNHSNRGHIPFGSLDYRKIKYSTAMADFGLTHRKAIFIVTFGPGNTFSWSKQPVWLLAKS